ncbi:MAG: rRNA maturation RNase YbeY [bacterium]|nr:rRNA maturation RNase YbeY [bacterium]
MKTSIECESLYEKELPISLDRINDISAQLLSYVLENRFVDGFSEKNDYSFDILLCDNNFIKNINRDYRKIDAPTDVITFALYSDSEEKLIMDNTINLGQIIISIDKTYIQAQENSVSAEFEFLNLLSHGILHLLGFDHPDEERLESMLELQNKMIESVDYVKI